MRQYWVIRTRSGWWRVRLGDGRLGAVQQRQQAHRFATLAEAEEERADWCPRHDRTVRVTVRPSKRVQALEKVAEAARAWLAWLDDDQAFGDDEPYTPTREALAELDALKGGG